MISFECNRPTTPRAPRSNQRGMPGDEAMVRAHVLSDCIDSTGIISLDTSSAFVEKRLEGVTSQTAHLEKIG